MLLPLRDQAMSEVLLLPSFRAMLVTLLRWLRSLRGRDRICWTQESGISREAGYRGWIWMLDSGFSVDVSAHHGAIFVADSRFLVPVPAPALAWAVKSDGTLETAG